MSSIQTVLQTMKCKVIDKSVDWYFIDGVFTAEYYLIVEELSTKKVHSVPVSQMVFLMYNVNDIIV